MVNPMEELSPKEFVILWNMEKSYGTDLLNANILAGFEAGPLVLSLEKKGLCKIEYRNELMYCFVATEKGCEVLEQQRDNPTYRGWIDD